MSTPLDTLPAGVQQTIADLTDGSAATLEEAIEQWQQERNVHEITHKDNQKFEQNNRDLKELWTDAHKLIGMMYADAGIMLRPKTREFAAAYDELVKERTAPF